MSLHRQLLTVLFSVLAVFFLLKGSFLTLQQFLIVPSDYAFQVQAQEPTPSTNDKTSQLPQRLFIPSAKIDLSITATPLNAGEWQISTKGVSLLEPDGGFTPDRGYIIYGHNWPVLLGRLKTTKIGDLITLQRGDNSSETYTIESIFTVDPHELSVLELAKPNTILIYTCTGFLDSQRLVVLAQKK